MDKLIERDIKVLLNSSGESDDWWPEDDEVEESVMSDLDLKNKEVKRGSCKHCGKILTKPERQVNGDTCFNCEADRNQNIDIPEPPENLAPVAGYKKLNKETTMNNSVKKLTDKLLEEFEPDNNEEGYEDYELDGSGLPDDEEIVKFVISQNPVSRGEAITAISKFLDSKKVRYPDYDSYAEMVGSVLGRVSKTIPDVLHNVETLEDFKKYNRDVDVKVGSKWKVDVAIPGYGSFEYEITKIENGMVYYKLLNDR